MRVKIGDHIAHHPSGNYLGVVTEVRKYTVSFIGTRMRDGLPVTFACFDEIRRCKPPVTRGGEGS